MAKDMHTFDHLLGIIDKLNSPDGCPWDRAQTLLSLRPYILEEVYELLEAVDTCDHLGIIEELGDVLFQVIFFAVIGSRDKVFSLDDVIQTLSNKLVSRHPHVFGDQKVDGIEDVLKHWEAAKKIEKSNRKHPFEGVPKALGALTKAQKMVKIAATYDLPLPTVEDGGVDSFSQDLLDLIFRANSEGVDLESRLRSLLIAYQNRMILSNKNAGDGI